MTTNFRHWLGVLFDGAIRDFPEEARREEYKTYAYCIHLHLPSDFQSIVELCTTSGQLKGSILHYRSAALAPMGLSAPLMRVNDWQILNFRICYSLTQWFRKPLIKVLKGSTSRSKGMSSSTAS
jgi:hypothetical protein